MRALNRSRRDGSSGGYHHRFPRKTGSAVTFLALLSTGCQYVASIDDRRVAPVVTETDGGTTNDAAPPGCVFDDEGDAALRFVQAVPGRTRADLCVKASGAAAWSDRPVTRGIGQNCPVGVGYRQATAPRSLPAGSFDLKVVGSDATSCEDDAISQLNGVLLGVGVTTVVHAQRGSDTVLLALPELGPTPAGSRVRFLHLLDGVERAQAYVADSSSWPPTATAEVSRPLAFGVVPTEATSLGGEPDLGYHSFSLPGAPALGMLEAPWQANDPGDPPPPWLVIAERRWASNVAYSAFLVGRVDDPEYPPDLLVCDESEDDGLWTTCQERPVHDLSVSVLHTTLSGADYPHYEARAEQMDDVVVDAEAEVLCLGFVMSDDHKRAIEQRAQQAGFEVAWADMDLTTPIDDPRRHDGTVPDPPSEPPCGNPEVLEVADEALACAADVCTGGAGLAGGVESTACVGDNCLSEFAAFLTSDALKRCGMCIAFSMLNQAPLAEVRDLCSSNLDAGMAFEGNSGAMLLSRLPIREVEHVALPSWAWRASVTKATVELPNDQDVDVYCTQLSTSVRAFNFPYQGPYGEGPLEGVSPWTNQSVLQASRVVELVERTSGPRPAVVLGALETGQACESCDPPLGDFGPEVLTELLAHLGFGVPYDYEPQCVECADNPLVEALGGGEQNLWTDHILMRGVARADVVRTRRVFEASTVSFPTEAGDVLVPPSSHYGLESVLRIR